MGQIVTLLANDILPAVYAITRSSHHTDDRDVFVCINIQNQLHQCLLLLQQVCWLLLFFIHAWNILNESSGNVELVIVTQSMVSADLSLSSAAILIVSSSYVVGVKGYSDIEFV